jgi:hypothetical protein
MDDWTEKIAKAVIPDMPSSIVSAAPRDRAKPKLTQIEAQRAAKLILDMRREEMRSGRAQKDSPEEEPSG